MKVVKKSLINSSVESPNAFILALFGRKHYLPSSEIVYILIRFNLEVASRKQLAVVLTTQLSLLSER